MNFRYVLILLSIGMCSLFAQLPPSSFYQLKRDVNLLSDRYHCLAQDEYGFIWFGSNGGGGLYRFDGYELKSFVINPDDLGSSLCSNRINTVASYGDGLIYIGTHGGWNTLNIRTGEIRGFADQNHPDPSDDATNTQPIIKDAQGHLWIGSGRGLSIVAPLEDKIERLNYYSEKAAYPDPRIVVDLLVDDVNPKLLWLGTGSGVFTYDMIGNKYVWYGPRPGRFETPMILDVFQDESHAIWAAFNVSKAQNTATVGKLVPETGSWTYYDVNPSTQSDGDVGAALYILGRDSASLWVSTSEAVGILNTKSGIFESWRYDPDRPDGLLESGFYRALMADRHGRLWIAGNHGIMYAKRVFVQPYTPVQKLAVCITDISIENERVSTQQPLLFDQELVLQRDQRDLTITYVLPNPLDPKAVLYEYQLEGFDKSWIQTGRRTVRYSNLSGGEYQFHIRAKEGNSVAFTESTLLPIKIDKKFIENWWFWTGLVMLMGILVYVIYRFNIDRIRSETRIRSEFAQQISEIQMQALRAQMNPHFIFNCLNSIKYYALNKDKNETADFLSKFALLVRTILNNSKSHTISLSEELAALRLYMEIEHLRLEDSFDYEISVDPTVNLGSPQIPPMVLQPYVENAIWHGLMPKEGRGLLKVHIIAEGEHIRCTIEDNGVGRSHAERLRQQGIPHKKSLGMEITQDRLRLIKSIYDVETSVEVKDLYDAEGNPQGTKVVIKVPAIIESASM